MSRRIVVFDAYGTLFDISAAARRAAGEPGGEPLRDNWQALATLWREKQLSYSWLRAITGAHTDFWHVTCDALDFALETMGLSGNALRSRLLQLYRELDAYPEVPAMLGELKAQDHQTAILSNGSPEMLLAAITSAGVGSHLDAVLSVEDAGVFKPDARVYDLVGQHFGCSASDVLFVSSNGWDAASATGYGFTSAWVNRTGQPCDRLPWTPTHTLTDLALLPELAGTL
ncbi:2-haloacid dehalogenase [Aliiruegeria haliotis]|uniref:(S)-2-haloacid dehalogenase n=1 Tax=Aliiruegeria haliotis TaxID=1280846 RepID=A0A2T0RW92_9RHOB|nr:haloacid dehalogenase type II [Aliiruegeria haliotis]PRY25428.1 2-haloacid dehalogenase [Aliiruegeria haliotis]